MRQIAGLCLTGFLVCAALNAADPIESRKESESAPSTTTKLLRKVMEGGPYEKPWKMEGIGKAHFPVTSSHPDVQRWFDQGVALKHSFWWFEAKRSFRWCLKLDPEFAMGYWALATLPGVPPELQRELLREASKRKDGVSERERLYIEAWAERSRPLPPDADEGERTRKTAEFSRSLENIILAYPDDVEAKALYWGEATGRYAAELVLQQILEAEPDHPGAHHYRIHNYRDRRSEHILDSSRRLPGITTKSGHTRHMPGHAFSGIGMWHSALIEMDAANRVELAYQRDHNMMPFDSWNYVHNRTYLSYLQGQLGMPEAAIRGAKDLLAAPAIEKPSWTRRSPQENGVLTLLLALVKFERWEEILALDWLPGKDDIALKVPRKHAETLAHLGLGDRHAAERSAEEHIDLAKEIAENREPRQSHEVQALEIRALLLLAGGKTLEGLTALGEAADREGKQRERINDPPRHPRVLYNVLGKVYLENGSPALAVRAFEKALEIVPNDGFAWAGLVEAHVALGQREEAQEAYSRLLFVWSDAEPGLAELERAKAAAQKLGLTQEPKTAGKREQRPYSSVSQQHLGSDRWLPNPVPDVDFVDGDGKAVHLRSYRGKNVVLVFHPGGECAACSKQLKQFAGRGEDLDNSETALVFVSNGKTADLAETLGEAAREAGILVDRDLTAAKSFKAYDDFEEKPIPATVLIDKEGRVYWARASHEPFGNFDFLMEQIRYLNDVVQGPEGLLAR